MTVTAAQFQTWLDDESKARCMLVEVDWLGVTDPVVGGAVNVALASNGSTATASSYFNGQQAQYSAAFTINGERAGSTWGTNGGWGDDTNNAYPDWLQVDFAASRVIDRVIVYSVQDNYAAPLDPPTGDGAWSQTGNQTTGSVLIDFEVQAWDGITWVTVGSVRDNEFIKRSVTFSPYKTSKIRILCLRGAQGYSRITEVEAWTPTAASGTEYLATQPFVSRPTDTPANRTYLSLVKEIPTFEQAMSDVMLGQTTANIGRVSVFGATSATDDWLFKREWIGRGVRLYIGDAAWPKVDFRSIWTGVIGNFSLSGTNEIIFEARDLQHLLNQTLRVSDLQSGPLTSQPYPVSFGPVYNVPAVLIDDVTHKYALHDNSVSAITAVRDNGKTATYTNNGDGTITMTSQPLGRITADLNGGTSGGIAIDNASDLIKHLVTSRGYLTINDLDIASFNTLKLQCPAKLGLFAPAADMTVYSAVDQVTNTVGAFTAVTREGKFYVKRFEFGGAPVLTITENDIVLHGLEVGRVIPAVAQIRIAAQTNYTPNQYINGGAGNATEYAVAVYQNTHLAVSTIANPSPAVPKSRTLPNPTPPKVGGSPDAGLLPSLFSNQADAQAEANRRMLLWGFTRYVFKVTCFITPLRLQLGDVVTLKHSRYGLSAGKNAVVIKINERPSRKLVELNVIL